MTPPPILFRSQFVYRQTLDHAVFYQHAPILRERCTDHPRTHGCILLGKFSRLVRIICLILTAIHLYLTGVTIALLLVLVLGLGPSTAFTEAHGAVS